MADQQIPETGQVREGDGLSAAPAPAPATPSTAPSGALPTAAGLGPQDYSASNMQSMVGTTEGSTSYTPDDTALVSKNLTKLISGDSEYMTLARTKAAQYANSRGLLNSSIAGGAGEAAAIEAALPIAQGDAQVNAKAQADNANVKNSFALDANQFARQGALAAASAGYNKDAQAADQQFKGTQSGLDRDVKTSQFDQDLALRTKQTDDERALKTATLEQELQRTYLDARTQLETSPNLNAEAKANAITALSDWFYTSVLPSIRASLGSPSDWPDMPTTGTTPPAAPPRTPPPATAPPPPRTPGVPYTDFDSTGG